MTEQTLINYTNTLDVMDKVEKLIRLCRYLQLRWKDEKQYEDRNEYIKNIKSRCNDLGFKLTKVNETFSRICIEFLYRGMCRKSKISLKAHGADYTLECLDE